MNAVLAKIVPHPTKFHQVWAQLRGKQPVYLWKPVPPSAAFVALGCVATTTPDEPPLDCVRCVPVSWVGRGARPPLLIWDDSGTAGSSG
jgi:vacuolar protein sorting-associated protein 13A/C